MHIEHADLGLNFDLPELKQRDLEAFYKAMRGYEPGWTQLSLLEAVGYYVRAAAKCGWLPGVKVADIEEWAPQKIRYLGNRLNEFVGEAVAVPLASPLPSPTTPTG